MFAIEIADNPNCTPVDLRVFHDLEPPHPVARVRLERPEAGATWCEVTGWTLEGRPCPVFAQKVDDSGEGVAVLVSGGSAGLRLRVEGSPGPWRLDDPQQWGEPFLILPSLDEVRS